MSRIIYTSRPAGLHAELVAVRMERGAAEPGLTLTGLSENSRRETCCRVRSAVSAFGIKLPGQLVGIFSPETEHNTGTYDLAVAVATLDACGVFSAAMRPSLRGEVLFMGELSLAGSLRPTRGVISHLIMARNQGFRRAVVPMGCATEAASVLGIDAFMADDLGSVVRWLNGGEKLHKAADIAPIVANLRGSWP